MAGRPLPLDGIRVVDASRVLAGPFATMLLADLGADVVKVEPPDGDPTRGWGPPWWGDPQDGLSAYFAAVNRNKRSIVLDLGTDAGRRLIDRLVTDARLLVHNYRPSTARRLGLDAELLAARHPALVVAAVGGFPGALADRPAYDLLAQAVSGFMAVTGEPDTAPTKAGVAVLDLLAGLEMAVGALALLVGGGGRSVEVSLVESSVSGLVNVLANHLAGGDEPGRHGAAHPNIVPYQRFATADGHVVIAVGTDAQFARLLGVLGVADADGRYTTNAARVAARDELVGWLSASIRMWDRDGLVAALELADVPAGPVNLVSEAVAAMEAAHGGDWLEADGEMRLAPTPIRIDGQRPVLRRGPPRLGQHTYDVLRSLGVDEDEVADLRARGVIR